ncbi:MAG: cytochrome c-type biogenesis protein CcmH [Brevundimonas sp.]|uniref:cytochrome c-type biogenesis protein n=1 Tax=Brevundimonas sp. TaxID=1871086 RepID=UPI0025BD59B7|nr:cytochrome c-type biogenesis protein [Brevundimonas sp.]MBX3477489.1 cytochrome c-type biogenesis protein CcmH [Brevundimonas sp.]
MRRALLISLAAMGLMAAEPAPTPDRPLADTAQEARAQALFDDIRCVVCQHEAIADSPAGVAADMRRLVREEIAAGRTDAQIRAGLVDRYGDYILFRPPVRAGTWLLWFGPFLLVLIAGAVLLLRGRKSALSEAPPLSSDEEKALADRLANDDAAP